MRSPFGLPYVLGVALSGISGCAGSISEQRPRYLLVPRDRYDDFEQQTRSGSLRVGAYGALVDAEGLPAVEYCAKSCGFAVGAGDQLVGCSLPREVLPRHLPAVIVCAIQ